MFWGPYDNPRHHAEPVEVGMMVFRIHEIKGEVSSGEDRAVDITDMGEIQLHFSGEAEIASLPPPPPLKTVFPKLWI